MDRLRMGVLGCSYHYFKRIAVPLRSSTLIEPFAIASRDAKKAEKAASDWGFPVSYGSYEALLSDPRIDFVFIPLPNHLHLPWIRHAADAGKPILCEKPLALSAHEAREAADYCASLGVPLMEAFMYRFHPQWRQASALVESLELGTIRATHAFFSFDNRDPANIRNIKEAGGGALLDIGCYAVSSARFLMRAEPRRAVSLVTRDPAFGTDIHSSAILDFGDGRRSTFSISTQAYPFQRVEALGSDSVLSFEVPFNMSDDVGARLELRTPIATRRIETEKANQYLLEFDSFARAIRDGAPVPTPISDAIANMAVLDALAASEKSGTWANVG